MSATRVFARPSAAAGFTVLEVMVVLIIVGLVAASLFEALSRVNDVRGRLSPFLSATEREALTNSWFRAAVNGIVPDEREGKNLFKGGPAGFSGLTLAPLAGDPGGPSPFKWELAYDGTHDRTVLRYTGFDRNPIEIRGWSGSKAAFSYLGPDQVWTETWPPVFRQTKQLPLAVRLYAQDEGVAIAAAIWAEKDPPPDPVAQFLGRGTNATTQ